MPDRPVHLPTLQTHLDDFERVPGLFRRWELQYVIDTDAEFRFESAGKSTDGTPLLAIYRREPSPESEN